MPKEYSDWRDGIIRDGFTRRAYLAESEGEHQELRFNYRPFLAEEVEEIAGRRDRYQAAGEDVKARGEMIKAVNRSLTEWSLKLRNGESVELNLSNIRRLPLVLQTKIYNIVCGFMPTQIDPAWRDVGDEDEDALPPLEGVQGELGKS